MSVPPTHGSHVNYTRRRSVDTCTGQVTRASSCYNDLYTSAILRITLQTPKAYTGGEKYPPGVARQITVLAPEVPSPIGNRDD